MKFERSNIPNWLRIRKSAVKGSGGTDITDLQSLMGNNFYEIRSGDRPDFYREAVAAAKLSTSSDLVKTVGKTDLTAARRINYLIEGVSYELAMKDLARGTQDLIPKIEFMVSSAKIASLSPKSSEAATAALAKYILLEGQITESKGFQEDLGQMAEAVSKDPITPLFTADLGISQGLRLKAFIRNKQGLQADQKADEVSSLSAKLSGLPTLGGEFHFTPVDALDPAHPIEPSLLRRMIFANMSQYQPGSFVPFAGKDMRVPELRMNPSNYAVSTANWEMLSHLFPELNTSYFTVTLGKTGNGEFDTSDAYLLGRLRGLASLVYAANFTGVSPEAHAGTSNFGDAWMGQTVTLEDGKFQLKGDARVSRGQANIFAGAGRTYPDMAYYLSMGMNRRDMLPTIAESARLTPDYAVGNYFEGQILEVFNKANSIIKGDPTLVDATLAGQRIMNSLRP